MIRPEIYQDPLPFYFIAELAALCVVPESQMRRHLRKLKLLRPWNGRSLIVYMTAIENAVPELHSSILETLSLRTERELSRAAREST